MIKPAPIKQRITDAVQAAGGQIDYYKLIDVVFPVDQFPRAARYQQNGGPPGCAMALGRTLREMARDLKLWDYSPERGVRTITLRRETQPS